MINKTLVINLGDCLKGLGKLTRVRPSPCTSGGTSRPYDTPGNVQLGVFIPRDTVDVDGRGCMHKLEKDLKSK